ncbi:MAG: hypothetical protein JKY48_05900 [Flavobacteriales bacterium]|nr:hypothetical protein [Flavobacteriales bacterium]
MMDLVELPFKKNIFTFLYHKLLGVESTEVIGLIVLFLLGYSILNLWKGSLKIKEVIGLAFPIGFGAMGTILFGYQFFTSGPIQFWALNIILLIAVLLLWIPHFIRFFRIGSSLNPFQLIDKVTPIKKMESFNLIQFISLFFAFIILITISLKGIYWPIADWDAITTFDFYGRVIAAEGKLVNSIVLEHVVGSGVAYPPLTHLIIAYSYVCGFAEPKWVFTLFYFAFSVVFYAFMRRFVNRTASSILLLLFVSTPELIGFSAFCKTNIVQMVYACLGFIGLYIWFKDRKPLFLYLSAFMLGLNAWVRSEGIEFVMIGSLLIIYELYKKRLSWKSTIAFFALSLSLFISWQIFMGANESLSSFQQVEIIKIPFFDADKLNTIVTHIYGHFQNIPYFAGTFYFFSIFFVLYLLFLKRNENHIFLIGIILVVVLHIFILYQINYLGDNMIWLLKYSLKRYIFNYIPLCFFFIATTYAFGTFTKRIEEFLRWDFTGK